MPDLYEHSVKTMLIHQAPSGAYVASPSFPTYHYCWFRDGAFIAYALDLAGEHASAGRFHGWVACTALRHAARIERAIEKVGQNQPLGDDYLHTRYTVEGETGAGDWPNFQTDGLGTWLWALAEHQRLSGQSLPPGGEMAVDLVARYLVALWPLPCYDLWEEHPQYQHPYTLAAIYAGLQAAGGLVPGSQPVFGDAAAKIKAFVLDHGVGNGHLIKSVVPPRGTTTGMAPAPAVDASLLGVATPYRLLSPRDPLMRATVDRIEIELHRPRGGVYRYRADTYYGGGEWLLLAAWLGWNYAEAGQGDRARVLLQWVEDQADARGDLPEQVSAHLLAPGYYDEWEARWGTVARPLLWSHAMYVVLRHALS
jgi:GH15 family glucan-1,4-alpha-glucosidase